MPTSDAASPSEAGDARPSCGLTASINYFFTPYYRKLSGECLPWLLALARLRSRVAAVSSSAAYVRLCADLRTFAHESLYDFLRSTPDARSATRPDRWRTTPSTSRDASDREEL